MVICLPFFQTNFYEERREQLDSSIYIDPQIDLLSVEPTIVIIEFKVKPAKVAKIIEGNELSIEEAKKEVEISHADFLKELETYLGNQHLAYTIVNSYKTSFNGVAIELAGTAINELLSSAVIKAIYMNHEVSIPNTPKDSRYQI